ncbi:MAG: prepilin peptidase [Gammaproteobacteria bacterium]|nr:prepilin peptidase [Gammaproteobacteria bacterium]
MSDLSIRPGMSLGSYPQRIEPELNELERSLAGWLDRIGTRLTRRRGSQRDIARRVKHYDEVLQQSSDEGLDAVLRELRYQLHRQGLVEPLMIEAFAAIREAAARSLGKRHFDTQLYGGWLMLNGMLAEMMTGEGKTLTTTLPACTAALAGIPVHVITANDYLAARDRDILLPLYRRLGLSASAVVEGMSPAECAEAYRADIVHTTNKQLAFDYLRDRIAMGEDTGDLSFQYREIRRRQEQAKEGGLLLRGLCFAIVDEADSVLIDEANTPLIITRSVPGEDAPETYSDALYLAGSLEADVEYRLDSRARRVDLTPVGEEKLAEQVDGLASLWRNERKRNALVKQALAAIHFYRRDREYMVVDDKVQIIDASTGRAMPDRAWEQGLHQMIEAKEGCLISEQREPQARISYQRFFSRYLRLGGTSGTVQEVSAELHRVYGLEVARVATHKPSRRKFLGERVYRDPGAQQRELLARVEQMTRAGRPVLIGTHSVEQSEQVGAWLGEAGIEHRVLNAKQDREEAEIIARAGDPGAVTVATNMAGRGTDIALGDGVEAAGGLHVLSLCLNDSYRVDRQLYGRSARQGDPGSAEAILSLADEALGAAYPPAILGVLGRFCSNTRPLPRWPVRGLLRFAQWRYERRQARIRKQLTKQDARMRRTLAFAGRFE